MTSWYINDDYYLKRSLVYNSIVMFGLIDNLRYINFNFSDNTYHFERDNVLKKYLDFDKFLLNESNFSSLEKSINDNDFIDKIMD